jgi:hypothetical protein
VSDLYTASRLRVFRECNRKHFYKYVLRILTQSTPAMAFGTHAHKALEHWYRAWQLGNPELRLVAALEYIDVADIDEAEKIRLRVLVVAYDARWSAEDWEVLGVEVEFRYFLGDVEIGGKIDALIRDRATGKVYVVEHKTSTADTSPGSPYWDRLCIDTQVSIYIDGAAMLDYDIAGCIYDVLKRPQHEPLTATPPEARKYTAGKGCKKCGGSAKAGEIEKGRGYYVVAFPGEMNRQISCDGCAGTGWKLNRDGQPEAPRLHSNQRDTDETLDAYEERVANMIAERVDDYLSRGVVVRLDSELPRMRQELLDTIAAMRALDEHGIAPPNHDACVRGRDTCSFFAACAGRADINNQYEFPRGATHPELASAA